MHKVVGANAYIGPLFRKNFSEGGPTWASAPTFLFAIMKIPIVNLFCNSSFISPDRFMSVVRLINSLFSP